MTPCRMITAFTLVVAAAGAACGGSSTTTGTGGTSTSSSKSSTTGTGGGPSAGFIGSLTITTIGSTVDPINGDQNPYGLAIAPVTAGLLTAGDLVICNFNDSNDAGNVQGTGTTIEILHPTPGSVPTRMVQDPNLLGCAALAVADDDSPWAAAYASNLAPFY